MSPNDGWGVPSLYKLSFGNFWVISKFDHWIRKYNFFIEFFPSISVPKIQVNERNLISKRNDKQLMFDLVPALKIIVNSFWSSIKQNVRVSLVLQWKTVNFILSLISDEKLNAKDYLVVWNLLVNWLRLKTYLNVSILKQRIFALKVACDKPTNPLVFGKISHYFIHLAVSFNHLSLISFIFWVRVGWIGEYPSNSTFSDWLSKFGNPTFPHSTDTSFESRWAFFFWQRICIKW